MLSSDDYAVVWGLYLTAGVGVLLVWWKVTALAPWAYFRQVLRVLIFVLIFFPWTLEPIETDKGSYSLWAPAFMVITMEAMVGGVAAASRAGLALLIAEYIALSAAFLVCVVSLR